LVVFLSTIAIITFICICVLALWLIWEIWQAKGSLNEIRSTENQNETDKSSMENQDETKDEEKQKETLCACLRRYFCACWRRKDASEGKIDLKDTIKKYKVSKKKKSKSPRITRITPK